jgi:hypothetical protein
VIDTAVKVMKIATREEREDFGADDGKEARAIREEAASNFKTETPPPGRVPLFPLETVLSWRIRGLCHAFGDAPGYRT